MHEEQMKNLEEDHKKVLKDKNKAPPAIVTELKG